MTHTASKRIYAPIAVGVVSLIYLVARSPGVSFFLRSLDHGYQLGYAQGILAGQVPGLDLFTIYGPLVGYSSAWARLLSGSMVGEILLCASGYALALSLAFAMMRRYANSWLAVLGWLLLLTIFSRYYKYYYWLFPLATAWMAIIAYERRLAAGPMAVWGGIAALAMLFRFDLGLHSIGLAFAATIIVVVAIGLRPILALRSLVFFSSGWLFTMGTMASALAVSGTGDPLTLFRFFEGALRASSDLINVYSSPVPTLTTAMRSPASFGYFCSFYLLPTLYLSVVVSIAIAFLRGHLPRPLPDSTATLMLCALAATAMFPQGVYRADISHLLQVLPLGVVTAVLCLHNVSRLPQALLLRGMAGATLLFLLPITTVSTELRPFSFDQRPYWEAISDLPNSARNDEWAQIAAALSNLTAPDDRVFAALPWTPTPILMMAGRAQAGLIPVYAPGVFETPEWIERNAAALRRHPPAALIVNRAQWADPRAATPPPFQPALLAEWRTIYSCVAAKSATIAIMTRNCTPATSADFAVPQR